MEDWREGIVVPVVKKGIGKRVEEYRGVTLTQTGIQSIRVGVGREIEIGGGG